MYISALQERGDRCTLSFRQSLDLVLRVHRSLPCHDGVCKYKDQPDGAGHFFNRRRGHLSNKVSKSGGSKHMVLK